MENKSNNCSICKIKAYLTCEECQRNEKSTYLCGQIHLNMHKKKFHSGDSSNNISIIDQKSKEKMRKISDNNLLQNQPPQIDIRKLFENLQKIKLEIDQNIDKKNFVESILLITKCLGMARSFYQPEDLFVRLN
jgi:hypothetical protein